MVSVYGESHQARIANPVDAIKSLVGILNILMMIKGISSGIFISRKIIQTYLFLYLKKTELMVLHHTPIPT